MRKALITGSEGFVGGYLKEELKANGYRVVGADLTEGPETRRVDLLDGRAVAELLAEEQPDVIIHLAAQADVGRSWKEPQKTIRMNVEAAVNLMEAIRAAGGARVRTVLVGSSDQYGALGAAGARVSEETAMRPMSPYAVSKKAQEELAALYVRSYGLSICMTRSFNHGGAGQRTGFLIPDFASGIVRIERGEARELLVGNLTSRRDFTHVRDVVRAYRLIAEKGRAGEVYNVGSGETHSAQEVLNRLREMAKCPVPVRTDPGRMRPSDTPVICCDHSKLTRDTGWQPELPFERILRDTLEDYRAR
ncbi:MAG: GDP-mannose 4,6-dehydratase [Clostridia bacterium]|nr:GDP-mannose 4,6-dehydratase [Clostridia bacterium]